ncbi:hypothetical protein K461DRAFT_225108 [Myriangium duriaei CBS 260.36]|uniref:DNA mismatch repair protein HSM3 N-terminal domain-containing protein n=1 Tax=Myriangium duriaei CBS 260.36 TaxID=1168546 RepID=A0A9P4J4I1_9PEZI|nr:hypothetical protein K461DRAFT_225108 [Myriangium duriaei CBS 260.36]
MMSNLATELQAHLDLLRDGSSSQIDERLIDSCCQVLPRQLSQAESVSLITNISKLAPTLPLDPTPLNKLLITLLEPYSFSDILGLSDNIDFVTGLSVRAVPYNRLLLAILSKATLSPSDAATIAGRPEVISALITLWLTTSEPGIGHEAGEVLYGLLKVDYQSDGFSSTSGQGLVWKRVFQDKDVYSLIYSICISDPKRSQHDVSRNQRTLAQSRLLELLPKLCLLDWTALTRSHMEQVERSYASHPSNGLLGFAAIDMVNTEDDVLMHKCLIEFFSDLIETVTTSGPDTHRDSSVSLDFLISTGVHVRLADFYVDPSESRHGVLEVQFLYSSVARYVATYASNYSDHFSKLDYNYEVLVRLQKALNLSPSQWAHQESPRHDLNVLASLPRAVLLRSITEPNIGSTRLPGDSVLSRLPTKQTNSDVLNTLATIFKGPSSVESLTYPEESPMMSSIDEKGLAEAQAARALYYLYIAKYNPNIFSDLVSHADSIALTDTALAAINVIHAVINSNWAPLPPSPVRRMISEADLLSQLPNPPPATPNSGPEAIIAPPSMEHTLPYLIKPARSFANIVGGRGDVESVAYKVAIAKFDALKSLHDRLQDVAATDPEPGYEQILFTLNRSVTRGPWSHQGDAGGRVATMEL